MSNFIHRLFNPHCPDCVAERQEKKICLSCDTLKDQLERVNEEKRLLLEALLKANEPTVHTPLTEEPRVLLPAHTPWKVKQALLEAEDRRQAHLAKEKEKEIKMTKVDTSDLEKELEIVQEEKKDAIR